ncbi:hypothetical protein F5887DRAFT_915179 [Amanita rubescens]|nr:hypothetical protein F5887DRAFT_927590 [Amanita rubescens]KAF8348055.1 hypothetical protein F5887DRAFT_915179 [Amanita rubescens]
MGNISGSEDRFKGRFGDIYYLPRHQHERKSPSVSNQSNPRRQGRHTSPFVRWHGTTEGDYNALVLERLGRLSSTFATGSACCLKKHPSFIYKRKDETCSFDSKVLVHRSVGGRRGDPIGYIKLSPAGVEPDPFALKSDDIIECCEGEGAGREGEEHDIYETNRVSPSTMMSTSSAENPTSSGSGCPRGGSSPVLAAQPNSSR